MIPVVTEFSDMSPDAVFSVFSDEPYVLWLDSSDAAHPSARYSFIMHNPAEVIEAKNGSVSVKTQEGEHVSDSCSFSVVRERLSFWDNNDAAQVVEGLPPFQGGAAGFFGYDLARELERLPVMAKGRPNIPDLAVGIYDQVLAFDHHEGKAWLITQPGAQAEQRHALYLERLKSVHERIPVQSYEPISLDWRFCSTPEEYKSRIDRIIEYIYAGDVFQVNIARRLEANIPEYFYPWLHYLHLRRLNPAPFGGYMNAGSVKLASVSPERFLTVRGRTVKTSPIKGTAPRFKNSEQDELSRQALERSEKDRAENIMIVDLLRNDLSKVCLPDSVTVPILCALESFTGVHHLVSTVTGTLDSRYSGIDLLKACFPGGSITGAPKIRAMEIIEELEPVRRGPYCGSLGYVGFNGEMDTNILIRTLVYDGDTVSLQAGGGITAVSDADAEYRETVDKVSGILKSF